MKTIHFFFFSILAFAFTSCQATAQDANTKRDIANIKAAYAALNQRNWDAFAALCDGENYTEVNVGMAPVKGRGDWFKLESEKSSSLTKLANHAVRNV
ncbi:MAG: hypothetical protein IPN76_35110 [Saprospiraceae bacterium]|nr:hypothetical protein [Saprospiraceae bacterium]